MENQFAVTEYHDVAEIYNKIDVLLAQPIRSVRKEQMEKYMEHFEKKCSKSKAMTTEAPQYIPGGVQHN